jgi:hypothetical protein
VAVVTRAERLLHHYAGSAPRGASRRAKAGRTGQNRAVSGDGDDHDPPPTAFALAVAGVAPALGNTMAEP